MGLASGCVGLAEYLLLCNAKNVSIKTTEKLLADGCNVGVNPGGMHEQVNTDHTKECPLRRLPSKMIIRS